VTGTVVLAVVVVNTVDVKATLVVENDVMDVLVTALVAKVVVVSVYIVETYSTEVVSISKSFKVVV
jgi:hypothetical protein